MTTQIKIYGSEGCQTCTKLKKDFENQTSNLEEEFNIEKVTKMTKLAEKGIMSTPAVEINGSIVLKDKKPSKEEVDQLLKENK